MPRLKRASQETTLGKYYVGKSEDILTKTVGKSLRGQVQLIFTSPPFPLNRKKTYGNLNGETYAEWLASFAPIFSELLTPTGSIVIELGNAWELGKPVQSLLPLQALLNFIQDKRAGLQLCQQFICHNPARLPTPAPWVTIERIRLNDSYTHLWWMSRVEKPKANNRNILRPYSQSTLDMLERGNYNHGRRPSGHTIREGSFLTDNGGSIMPNVIEVEPINPDDEVRLPGNAFSIPHTTSNDYYQRKCKERGIETHPARMPRQLVDIFINFLTDTNDLVLDPFAGSNTTGFCAERLGRRWVSIEANKEYLAHSEIRLSELERPETPNADATQNM